MRASHRIVESIKVVLDGIVELLPLVVCFDVFCFFGNIVGNKVGRNRNDLVLENPRKGAKLVEFGIVRRIHD